MFLHVTPAEQERRLKDRLNHPWKRWKTGVDDYRNRARRPAYLAAIHEMLERTDSRWAPWQVIDGNEKLSARIAVLRHVADRLESAVSMEPPASDPAVVAAAQLAFGMKAPKD